MAQIEEKEFIENLELSKDNDLLVELRGKKRNECQENNIKGNTLLKERLIRALGYKLLVISAKECELKAYNNDKIKMIEKIVEILHDEQKKNSKK
mgnify:CR=1 FL=1